jgi:predicted nucleic acid-binding protein
LSSAARSAELTSQLKRFRFAWICQISPVVPSGYLDSAGLIEAWTRFAVQDITLSIMKHALEIRAKHGFSYWDSAIVAAACAQGCSEVYSDDMAHGRQIENIVIVNPFRNITEAES